MDLTKVEFAPEHYPVLWREVVESFKKFEMQKEAVFLDGTFGRGGHTGLILSLFPEAKAIVFDQDLAAIEYAKQKFPTEVQSGRLRVIHDNFANFANHNLGQFDMMLLDLGVSSPQLDNADRGFSFNHDGPLDMRMDQTQELTADYIVNTASEDELIRLFQNYGEIYKPFRVVRALVHDRKTKAFKTTRELASLIERVDGWRHKGFHPATQYFMALRLAVNGELDVVAKAVPEMMNSLKMGGRLAVISFHSLEDRIVKNFFRESKELGLPVNKKVIVATQEECDLNSRSRSAKLRVFERGAQDEPKKYSSAKAFR